MAQDDNPKFQAGEAVRLKTGGPEMTIIGSVRSRREEGSHIYSVVWFDNRQLQMAKLPEPALERCAEALKLVS